MKKKGFLTWINARRAIRFLSEIPETLFAIALIFAVLALLYFFEKPEGYIHDQFPGLMLDIAVFGILIVVFNKIAERRRDIKRWREEIDDYRGWNEEEAKFRIIGNIRRLMKVGIHNIDLSNCFLEHAYFEEFDLHGSCFHYTILNNSKLLNTKLKNASFRFARLCGALFHDAELSNVDFAYANLLDAQLYRANLSNSNMRNTQLKNAIFENANLQSADFYKAILTNADFSGANLLGAEHLTIDQISAVKTLYNAKIPPTLLSLVKERYPKLLFFETK